MSQRFYVNGEQIFGNNEMFPKTHDEIARQGGVWDDDDLILPETEITDPQALMDAVEEDSLQYLKKCCIEYWDEKKGKEVKKPFSRVTDKDLLLSSFWNYKEFKVRAYARDGSVKKNVWRQMKWMIEEKRIFTSLNLYLAIKSEVEMKDGKLVLKDGGKITASMF